MSGIEPHATAGFSLSSARGLGLRAWFVRHVQSLFFTLGQIARAPLSALLTGSVIGIALALPAGLLVLLDNTREITRGWDATVQVSLYLRPDVDDRAAGLLGDRLRARPDIVAVSLIERDEALQEFQRLTGFDRVAEAFGGENPLPAVLVVTPRAHATAETTTRTLLDALRALPEVEIAQADLGWLDRLRAIFAIAHRAIYLLSALLGVGVMLVIGNTIRLGIDNRRDEIEIARLFGASNAFIRRPFLYSGTLLGLLGGLVAWCLVTLGVGLLDGPVRGLAKLYSSDFAPAALSGTASATLLGSAAALGLLGSWIAVGRHLVAAEPG